MDGPDPVVGQLPTTGIGFIKRNQHLGAGTLTSKLNAQGFVRQGEPWTVEDVRVAKKSLDRAMLQGRFITQVRPKHKVRAPSFKRLRTKR